MTGLIFERILARGFLTHSLP